MKSLLITTMLAIGSYADQSPPGDAEPIQIQYSSRYYGSDHPKGDAQSYRYRGESTHPKRGGYGQRIRERLREAPRDWHYQPRRYYEAQRP